MGPLWRLRGRVENEIGRMGNLGTILRTVRCWLVSCGSVGMTQTTQTVRLSWVVSLEPRTSLRLHDSSERSVALALIEVVLPNIQGSGRTRLKDRLTQHTTTCVRAGARARQRHGQRLRLYDSTRVCTRDARTSSRQVKSGALLRQRSARYLCWPSPGRA